MPSCCARPLLAPSFRCLGQPDHLVEDRVGILDVAIHPDVAMAASVRTPVVIFADPLHQAGITLTDVDGRLVGSGGCYCAAPWHRLIDARSDALRDLGYPCANSDTKRNVGAASASAIDSSALGNAANLQSAKPGAFGGSPQPVDLSKLTDFDRMAAANWDTWVKTQAEEDALKEAAKNRRWAKREVTE